jgi:hypothetical protein
MSRIRLRVTKCWGQCGLEVHGGLGRGGMAGPPGTWGTPQRARCPEPRLLPRPHQAPQMVVVLCHGGRTRWQGRVGGGRELGMGNMVPRVGVDMGGELNYYCEQHKGTSRERPYNAPSRPRAQREAARPLCAYVPATAARECTEVASS